MTALKDRTMGVQFSGSERNLLFKPEYENIGFVRVKNLEEKSFYLDPSPIDNTRKNEFFILKNCPVPMNELQKGLLIEVIVSEEDKIVNYNKKGQPDSYTKVKYVSNCRLVNPNKIINGELITRDEFLEYISVPLGFRHQWDMEDIQYCTGLYMVASPQVCNEIKGGINTAVLASSEAKRKYGAFKKITSIIPSELQKPIHNNYYFLTDRAEKRKPIYCSEVSGSYFNVYDYPVHVPIPFDVGCRTMNDYKDEFNYNLPLTRGFMLDAILFRPFVPDTLFKRMEDAMHYIYNDYFSTLDVPVCVDLGNCIPKLITSFARLDFKNIVTSTTLDQSLKLWASSFERATKSNPYNQNPNTFYRSTRYTDILRKEIRDLFYTGVILIVPQIKANSQVPEWSFDETLEKLSLSGDIYFRTSNEIGFLEN